MNLRSKRRLAAEVLKVGKDRIVFDDEYADLIQDAITRSTIRGLVGFGAIKVKPKKGVSRGRIRIRRKGEKRGKGPGSKEGTSFARISRKERWVLRVRALRKRLKVARDRNEITKETFKSLYSQIKGGQIRTVRQLLGMIKEARR
jgi:large subunit ribosomal protein L19e